MSTNLDNTTYYAQTNTTERFSNVSVNVGFSVDPTATKNKDHRHVSLGALRET